MQRGGGRRVRSLVWGVAAFATVLAGLGAGSASTPASYSGSPSAAAIEMPTDPHGVRVDRKAAISASFPAAVATGTRIRVTGVARLHAGTRRAPRPVKLVERKAGRWMLRAKRTTTRTGAFVLRTTAGSRERTLTFKVVAPRFRGLAAAATRGTRVAVRSAVVPDPAPEPEVPAAPDTPDAYPPLGDPNDWRYLFADGGARWDPCVQIVWRYNPQGQPYAGALADVNEALRRISDRTGLRFAYAGTTSYIALTDAVRPDDAQFFVAWADETQVSHLAGNVVGVGGGSATRVDGADVQRRFTRGHLVLDKAHRLRTGHDLTGSPTWGQVMDHEVLHAVGLGHAAGQEQLMYPSVSSLNHRFGAGDLTGMTRIGAEQGCL